MVWHVSGMLLSGHAWPLRGTPGFALTALSAVPGLHEAAPGTPKLQEWG